MTHASLPARSHDSGVSRLLALLWRRSLVKDVLLGIVAGYVLAWITAILIISVVDSRMQTTANGWSTTRRCGAHRNGILLRAACASDIAALNLPEEEVYWQTWSAGGHRLNGQHAYVLHFPPGGLPPASAAWSLTVGDWRRRMVDNPIHRYSLGGTSGLVPNADGSIDIYIQSKAPAVHQANWLPAPAGDFMLWLRVYQPGAAILQGKYRVPPVVQVQGGRD